MAETALRGPARWNLKHLLILITFLAVGFGVFGIAGTLFLGLIVSPVVLAPRARRMARLFWVAAFSPLFVLAGLYLIWADGWIALGHPPRFWVDDPKDIALSEGLDRSVTLVWLAAPFLFTFALVHSNQEFEASSRSQNDRLIRSRRILLIFLIAFVSFVMFAWDPLNIMKWLMD
jgi:hypothetical protein